MRPIYVASRNQHKLREIRGILGRLVPDIRPCPDDVVLPPETGATFEENALLKARALEGRVDGLIVSEDSGLEVERLGGRPGILSARFAGDNASDPDNIALLLRCLEPFPDPEDRKAAFVAVVCLLEPSGPRFFRGEVRGRIARWPRGVGGFGYDPVFEMPDSGRTFAELSPEEKNAVSHRSIAFRRLAQYLAGRH